jgi:hypothetical protein
MRGCATCAELEQLLEKTADHHWNLVVSGSEADPGQAKATPHQVRDAKLAADEALARYKLHIETAHSRSASSGQ